MLRLMFPAHSPSLREVGDRTQAGGEGRSVCCLFLVENSSQKPRKMLHGASSRLVLTQLCYPAWAPCLGIKPATEGWALQLVPRQSPRGIPQTNDTHTVSSQCQVDEVNQTKGNSRFSLGLSLGPWTASSQCISSAMTSTLGLRWRINA